MLAVGSAGFGRRRHARRAARGREQDKGGAGQVGGGQVLGQIGRAGWRRRADRGARRSRRWSPACRLPRRASAGAPAGSARRACPCRSRRPRRGGPARASRARRSPFTSWPVSRRSRRCARAGSGSGRWLATAAEAAVMPGHDAIGDAGGRRARRFPRPGGRIRPDRRISAAPHARRLGAWSTISALMSACVIDGPKPSLPTSMIIGLAAGKFQDFRRDQAVVDHHIGLVQRACGP